MSRPRGVNGAPGRCRVLVVDPDRSLVRQVATCAEGAGVEVAHACSSIVARRMLTQERWDYVFVQLRSRVPERELARWMRQLPSSPEGGRPHVVAVTDHPSVSLTLRAERLDVRDILCFPLDSDRVRHALNGGGTTDERRVPLPPVEPQRIGALSLVTESPRMLEIYKRIARIAPSTLPVLLLGESGTGKELAARAIHELSDRRGRPFVAVNCAAIPEGLLESELFGAEPGAFTGATHRLIGRFERANGGTLLLDEIGDMSLALQSKILRALNDGQIERLGATAPVRVDVRPIAATNNDIRRAIHAGRFREDLYYRVGVVTLELPRLAERGNDLLLLTAQFIREFNERHGRSVVYLTESAVRCLRGHRWHGNVRELRNVIEQAVVVAHDATITASDLADEYLDVHEASPGGGAPSAVEACGGEPGGDGFLTLRELEARHIARVLAHTGGQVAEASRILRIHRNTLARKIREHILT